MKKASLLLVALVLIGATALTAVPAAQPQTQAQVQVQNAQPPAQPVSKADFLLSLDTAQHVCNLLCIQGFHCCFVQGQPTCVPETQACHGG